MCEGASADVFPPASFSITAFNETICGDHPKLMANALTNLSNLRHETLNAVANNLRA